LEAILKQVLVHILALIFFCICSLTAITVTGFVTGNDNPTVGLESAVIELAGVFNYTASTNISGEFTISDVVTNLTYSYTVTHENFSPAYGTITVGSTDCSMGTIVLNEIANLPTNVIASYNGPNIDINWQNAIGPLPGYKIWRLQPGQENNEAVWSLLTPQVIFPSQFTDTGWSALPEGFYKWAVKAVYAGSVLSEAAFSNELQNPQQVGTLTGLVIGSDLIPVIGARISCPGLETFTDNSGHYSLFLPVGTLDVMCSAPGYGFVLYGNVNISFNQTTVLDFVLEPAVSFTEDFEDYPLFVIDFPPWINVDLDHGTSNISLVISFPNNNVPQAFMIFNPADTNPPITGHGAPHSGVRMAVCISNCNIYATAPVNNDWLISPLLGTIASEATVSFWARSFTTNPNDWFRVFISEGQTNPDQFILLAGDPYIEPPSEWTYYTCPIPSEYYGKVIRIAINCISDNSGYLMIDDFMLNPGTQVANVDPELPEIQTVLYGNYPNPFSLQTNISYSVKAATPVHLQIYNVKGQLVKSLVQETRQTGRYTAGWNGTDDQGGKVCGGVYLCRLNCGGDVFTRKMILIK
jgi:hypothetical protein